MSLDLRLMSLWFPFTHYLWCLLPRCSGGPVTLVTLGCRGRGGELSRGKPPVYPLFLPTCDVPLSKCDVFSPTREVSLPTCEVSLPTCDVSSPTCDAHVMFLYPHAMLLYPHVMLLYPLVMLLYPCDVPLPTCDVPLPTCDVPLPTCDFPLPGTHMWCTCDVLVMYLCFPTSLYSLHNHVSLLIPLGHSNWFFSFPSTARPLLYLPLKKIVLFYITSSKLEFCHTG